MRTGIYNEQKTRPIKAQSRMRDNDGRAIQDEINRRIIGIPRRLIVSDVFNELAEYAVITADFDGNVLTGNKGASLLYGFSPEEFAGNIRIELLFPPEFIKAGMFQEVIKALMEKGSFTYTEDQVRKNGQRFHSRVLFVLLRDGENRILGLVGIAEDTNLKAASGEGASGSPIPICAGCKKIREDNGRWSQAESYLARHLSVFFSHGLCLECARKIYPEAFKEGENAGH